MPLIDMKSREDTGFLVDASLLDDRLLWQVSMRYDQCLQCTWRALKGNKIMPCSKSGLERPSFDYALIMHTKRYFGSSIPTKA